MMSEAKTKMTKASVEQFLRGVKREEVRDDCHTLIEIMERASGEKAKIWGSSIIGFGEYHYKYESGREGDTLRIGFSPRSANIAVYMAGGVTLAKEDLRTLGKFTTGKGCLYIKKLSDVDEKVLTKMLKRAFKSVD